MFIIYEKITTPRLISLLSIGKTETKELPFVSHEDYSAKEMDVEQHVYIKRVHVAEDLLLAMFLKPLLLLNTRVEIKLVTSFHSLAWFFPIPIVNCSMVVCICCV
jgi:hypothetical protein